MLTKWTVSNFKSIRDKTELALAPLTIFAGPNSSGKSTLLQSILLISQTLVHKISARPVVLNGSLVRLGEIDDLKSCNNSDSIEIGWDCRPLKRIAGAVSSFSTQTEELADVSCTVAFRTASAGTEDHLEQRQPVLSSLHVSVRDSDHLLSASTYIKLKRISVSTLHKAESLQLYLPDFEEPRASLEYDVTLDPSSLNEITEEYDTAEPTGCVLNHFLPDFLTIRIRLASEIAARIYAAFSSENVFRRRARVIGEDVPITEDVVNCIRNTIGEPAIPLFSGTMPRTVAELIDRARSLPFRFKRQLRTAADEHTELRRLLLQVVSGALSNEPAHRLLPCRIPSGLQRAIRYVDTFFSASVKYLGPLRDEPKPVYPLTTSADPSDIGIKGEYTAAVLELRKNRSIRYIPSRYYAESLFESEQDITPVLDAVTDWLRYLELADAVSTTDLGKFGHQLRVAISGKDHDLTHVGVGVSQVLPILVSGLLADTDATLIFEQPELHLHPAVQTRLADFFLSLTDLGKQCIVETHSEYLINRLRYRAALQASHEITSRIKIYFVELTDGTSHFTEVKMNEYGAIHEWPQGFFDQSQREIEIIMRAALDKKMKRRRLPNDKSV